MPNETKTVLKGVILPKTKLPLIDTASESMRLAVWSAHIHRLNKITRGCILEGIFKNTREPSSKLLFDMGMRQELLPDKPKEMSAFFERDTPLSNGASAVIRSAGRLALRLNSYTIGNEHILWSLTTQGTGKKVMIPSLTWGVEKESLQRKLLEIYSNLTQQCQIK